MSRSPMPPAHRAPVQPTGTPISPRPRSAASRPPRARAPVVPRSPSPAQTLPVPRQLFSAPAVPPLWSTALRRLPLPRLPGTGTVDIRVVTSAGTSATTLADLFTYIAAPAVTGISPAAGTTAGGTSVTISGTNFSGATGVKFGSNAATGVTVVSATSITAVSPAGTGTVDVTVTTASGTSASGPSDQFTYRAGQL